MSDVKIESSWKKALKDEFLKPYFVDVTNFVKKEYLAHKNIFPGPKDIFRAFDLCPIDKVSVVIIGQDPYHGIGQANGLCFAVPPEVSMPPSLKNIFQEIRADLGVMPYQDGDLSRWARQGVLLLNATLTVEAHKPGSHQNKGWEKFTDAIIAHLSQYKTGLVFLLWGNYAKQKGVYIDKKKHLVLETTHPSPFSASAGFFNCKHFSKTNRYLRENGKKEIDWR